jgi:hypothetical protein
MSRTNRMGKLIGARPSVTHISLAAILIRFANQDQAPNQIFEEVHSFFLCSFPDLKYLAL